MTVRLKSIRIQCCRNDFLQGWCYDLTKLDEALGGIRYLKICYNRSTGEVDVSRLQLQTS